MIFLLYAGHGVVKSIVYETRLSSWMTALRYNMTIASYRMPRHANRQRTRTTHGVKEIFRLLRMAREHAQTDGLNSVVG